MRILGVVVMAAVLVLGSGYALAADLTGTYVGKTRCKLVEGNGEKAKRSSKQKDENGAFLLPGGRSELRITSLAIDLPTNSAELAVAIDGVLYSGRAVLDRKRSTRKGIAALAACENASDAVTARQNVWRLTFRVSDAGLLGGSVKGKALFADGAGGAIGECRGAWKMTARTASPPVPAGCE